MEKPIETFQEFVKIMSGTDETKKLKCFELMMFGEKERERHRQKSRKRYHRQKGEKISQEE